MLAGLPSWQGFAGKVLEQLVKAEIIDYREEHQIKASGDAKKWLSLASIIAKDADDYPINCKTIFSKEPSGITFKPKSSEPTASQQFMMKVGAVIMVLVCIPFISLVIYGLIAGN